MFEESELDRSQFQGNNNREDGNNQGYRGGYQQRGGQGGYSGQHNQDRGNGGYNNNRGGGNFNRGGGGFNRGGGGNFNRGGGSNYGSGGGRQNFYRKQDNDEQGETKLYKAYSVMGNRDTPQHIIDRIAAFCKELAQFGYTPRVGGMDALDEAIEKTCQDAELHIPWKGFNGKESKSQFNTKQVNDIAKMFHPTYDGLNSTIQAFLGKNARLVLGRDLRSPAMFIICWTDDGAENSKEKSAKTGNVGHVISIASSMRIPTFNFGKQDAEQRLRKYLELTTNGETTTNVPAQQNSNNNDDYGF